MKLKGVHTETTRHGATAYYYRPKRGRRIRLPDDYGTENFTDAVRMAALVGEVPTRHKKPTAIDTTRGRISVTLARAIKGAKQRAKAKGLPFDLDMDWALDVVERQGLRCALTNIPFFTATTASGSRHPFAPSLDRTVPSLGYTKANVRIVAFAINVMLLDWGPAVLERITSGYRYITRTNTPALSGQPPAPRKCAS